MLYSDISLIIKTFERQGALERLLDSIIEQGYTNCPVLIADDSKDPYRDAILKKYDDLVDCYLVLPFDSGVSKGRNELLDHIETEYFVLNDDDYVYDGRTDLAWMRQQLEENDLDLLGGVVYDRVSEIQDLPWWTLKTRIRNFIKDLFRSDKMPGKETVHRYHGHFEVKDDTIILHKLDSYSPPYTRCDYALQFFMAKTDAVREKVGGWNKDLKSFGEHWEFFYRGVLGGLKVATTEEVGAVHMPVRNKEYNQFRFREEHYLQLSLKKHGFKERVIK